MINASLRRPTVQAALAPVMIRRRRALRIAPPAKFIELRAAYVQAEVDVAPAYAWRGDLRFFVGCYLAGLAFFLIILS